MNIKYTGMLNSGVRFQREEGNGDSPSEDEIFNILSNRRRRLVVQVLKRRQAPADIHELSEQVAALENDIEPEEVTYRQRKSVYTSLHQNHLPQMVEAGMLEMDRRWENLRLSDRAASLDAYLGDKSKSDSSSEDLYLFLSLFSGFNVSMGALGVYPWSLPPGIAYAVAVVCLFIAVALLRKVLSQRAFV